MSITSGLIKDLFKDSIKEGSEFALKDGSHIVFREGVALTEGQAKGLLEVLLKDADGKTLEATAKKCVDPTLKSLIEGLKGDYEKSLAKNLNEGMKSAKPTPKLDNQILADATGSSARNAVRGVAEPLHVAPAFSKVRTGATLAKDSVTGSIDAAAKITKSGLGVVGAGAKALGVDRAISVAVAIPVAGLTGNYIYNQHHKDDPNPNRLPSAVPAGTVKTPDGKETPFYSNQAYADHIKEYPQDAALYQKSTDSKTGGTIWIKIPPKEDRGFFGKIMEFVGDNPAIGGGGAALIASMFTEGKTSSILMWAGLAAIAYGLYNMLTADPLKKAVDAAKTAVSTTSPAGSAQVVDHTNPTKEAFTNAALANAINKGVVHDDVAGRIGFGNKKPAMAPTSPLLNGPQNA